MHGFTLHVAWCTLHVASLILLCRCTPSHRSEHLLAHAVAGGRELEGRGERQAVDRRVQRAQLLAQQPRQHRDHLVCSAAQRTWRPRTVAFSSVCSAVADFPLSCCPAASVRRRRAKPSGQGTSTSHARARLCRAQSRMAQSTTRPRCARLRPTAKPRRSRPYRHGALIHARRSPTRKLPFGSGSIDSASSRSRAVAGSIEKIRCLRRSRRRASSASGICRIKSNYS